MLVVDEAWAILANLGCGPVAPVLLEAVAGPRGGQHRRAPPAVRPGRRWARPAREQVGLAEGLLADSETRVVYAQSPGEVARTGELLGLTETEAELVTQLPRGMALWKVGRRSFLVEHRLGRDERWLVDTDRAMADEPTPPDPTPGRRR